MQTSMDMTHLETWHTTTGHNARANAERHNNRMKVPMPMLSNISISDYKSTMRKAKDRISWQKKNYDYVCILYHFWW